MITIENKKPGLEIPNRVFYFETGLII